jgi:hypothetical protein
VYKGNYAESYDWDWYNSFCSSPGATQGWGISLKQHSIIMDSDFGRCFCLRCKSRLGRMTWPEASGRINISQFKCHVSKND